MWEWIKSQFTTKEFDATMLRREVEEFHNGLVVNNRQSTAQIRRRKRETGERMELVKRTNEDLEDIIGRADKQQ